MPLYQDVEAEIVARISQGIWHPGTRLPNEFALADEFGVSQGTMRKALGRLEERGLVTRRPRHGTVVAEQTDEKALFAFFRLRGTDGTSLTPEPGTERIVQREVREDETILEGRHLWEITRVRLHQGTPFSHETILLPENRCPDLDKYAPFPNSLYPFLEQTYRVSIDRIEEALTAVMAKAPVSTALHISDGLPLLRVKRQTYDLNGTCIELRDSFYLSDNRHYSVTLMR